MSGPPQTAVPVKLADLKAALPEWTAFEQYYAEILRETVYPKHWLLERLLRYYFRQKGKQIRPLTLLYIAKAAGEIQPASFVGAALIEILHNATLTHDDVVDESDYRRGSFSFRGLWGNKIAVLWGDWLLARGLLLALRENQHTLLAHTSAAVEALAEGELLQLKRIREANLSPEGYFAVIDKKTASLFEATCVMGAWSAGGSEATIALARQIGRLIGRGFQIRDDLLDWTSAQAIGKPSDADRRQKRFTLPVLWALEQASPAQKRDILQGSFQEARRTLEALGAFSYVEGYLQTLLDEASLLAEKLPYAHRVPLRALFRLLLFRKT